MPDLGGFLEELAASSRLILFDGRASGYPTGRQRPAPHLELVRCSRAIVEAVKSLGLEVRVGVHTGEVQMINGKVGGMVVNIGARVAGIAKASELLVSSTVRDLTAGSGLLFEDAGEHQFKGVPDSWRIYRVLDAAPPHDSQRPSARTVGCTSGGNVA